MAIKYHFDEIIDILVDLTRSYSGRRPSSVPVFPEHALTYGCLSAKPQENLRWSLLCPRHMNPVINIIEILGAPPGHPPIASADCPPGWQEPYCYKMSVIGLLFGIIGDSPRYATNLEDCVDSIAADLAKTV